uniref:Uncharacterized protein n=1 Tax=Panagrolaimus superbus TaxID=310955 RepID=A0A914YU66_9BILA
MEEDLKNQKDENTILKNSANTFEQNIVLLENNVKELKLIVERQESLSESMTLLNDILEKKVATLEVQNERQAAELERLCDSLYMHKKNARIEKPEVPKTP